MDWFKGKSNQETMDFPIKYGVETSKFSLKPIHWTSGQRLQEALGLAANYSDGRRSTTAPAMSKHLGAAAVFSGKNMGIHQWSSNYNRNIKWIVGITWEYDGNILWESWCWVGVMMIYQEDLVVNQSRMREYHGNHVEHLGIWRLVIQPSHGSSPCWR